MADILCQVLFSQKPQPQLIPHKKSNTTMSGDNAIKQDFGSVEVSGLGANITRIIDVVTTNCLTNAMRLGFHWAVSDNVAKISGFVSC